MLSLLGVPELAGLCAAPSPSLCRLLWLLLCRFLWLPDSVRLLLWLLLHWALRPPDSVRLLLRLLLRWALRPPDSGRPLSLARLMRRERAAGKPASRLPRMEYGPAALVSLDAVRGCP